MLRFFFLIFLVLSLYFLNTMGVKNGCTIVAPDPSLMSTFSTASYIFNVNFFKTYNSTANVFSSPFSVQLTLAMTAVGAKGTTLTQLSSCLHPNQFHAQSQINQAFGNYLNAFCPSANYTLLPADRIFLQQDFPILKKFVKTLNKYYKASAVNVNFKTNLSGAVQDINDFVDNSTNGQIQNLVSTDSIAANTSLILVNAQYFRGLWQTAFDPTKTRPANFNLATGQSVQVPTMSLQSQFLYTFSQTLNSQVLQLNYTGNVLAMHVILPQEGTNVSTVQQVLTPQAIAAYISAFEAQQVQVNLPKFNVSYKQEINSQLKSLGIVDMFDASKADLSGIAKGNLYVSSVVHQADVVVDEQGSMGSVLTTPQAPSVILNANRPFIFLICDLVNNVILFIGYLMDPLNKANF